MRIKIYKHQKKSLLFFFTLIILNVFFLSVYTKIIVISDWMQLYVPMLLVVVVSFLLFKTDRMILPLGANAVVLVYMELSTMALLLLLPFFPEIENIRSELSMSFLHYEEMTDSVCIACIGITSFVIFTSVFSHRVGKNVSRNKVLGKGISDMESRNTWQCELMASFAIFLLLLCLIYYVVFLVTHLRYLSIGYTDRTSDTNENSLYSHTTVLMGLSAALLATVADMKKLKWGLFICAFLAIIHFLLGNRGEIYYPLLAGIAVYTKRKGTFRKSILTIGIFGSFSLIAIVRIVRSIGIGTSSLSDVLHNISPLSAVAEAFGEMGFQIGTIAYMLRYLNSGGSLQYGATYVYTFQKFLHKYIPFIPGVNTESPAAIKTIMPTTYYAFTNIGEAYFNFSIVGVYIFCIILAWYLVKHSKFERNIYSEIFFNMFLVELILWVRNSSATMPVYLGWTIILTTLCKIICGIGKKYYIDNENQQIKRID